MNERIKELMKQAGTDTSGKWMGVEHAEKFAQLIIDDCIQVTHATIDNSIKVAFAIENHFGLD